MEIAAAWRIAKGAAVLILLLSVWLHGGHTKDVAWQAKWNAHTAEDSKALAAAEAKARKQEQDAQARVSIAETVGYTALQEKQNENERLRAAVAAGTARLRIKASCSLPAAAVPAESPGMGDGATAELTADARQDYFDLRAGIIHQHQQLTTCQYIVRVLVR